MQIKCIAVLFSLVYVTTIFVHYLSAQTITKNQIGVQGEYHYEYCMDYGTANKSAMALGDGGNFSCSWDSVQNILFKKGKMPGEKNQIITYSADYNPAGNSYIGAYGWTKDPLVEYYIVDSWGSWKPPGVTSKGTLVSDSGIYDIYEQYPKVALGIQSFKQFWSVRQNKRTSGTITCANHFNAWAAKNMVMGEMYEVMFFVEGYQSRGTADVKMSMTSGSTAISGNLCINESKTARPGAFGTPSQTVMSDGRQTLTF